METPGFLYTKKKKWAIKRNLKIFYVKIDYKKINYVLKNRKEKYINRIQKYKKMRENLVSRLILVKKTLIYLIGTKEEKKNSPRKNLYARCYLWLTIFLKKVAINLS